MITLHLTHFILMGLAFYLYKNINQKACFVRDAYFSKQQNQDLHTRLGGKPKDWFAFFALLIIPVFCAVYYGIYAISGGNYPVITMLSASLLIAFGFKYFSPLIMKPTFPVQRYVEKVVLYIMAGAAMIAVLTTFGIIFSLITETIKFAGLYSFFDFLFGTQWSPQVAFKADQAAATGAFGMLPLMVGTLLITVIALLIAVPMGLGAAIYLSEYASLKMRRIAKPVLEILAGIPTVVYGFLTVVLVAPAFRQWDFSIGLDISSESALAVSVVMGIMIIPYISSLSDDVLNAVPQTLRDGALAVGSTKSEMVLKIVLPSALPGIVSAFILAFSRAIGETMIVVMAAGLSANLTVNPFDAVTTMTVQIATLLTGDQEFDSVKTLSAFALGMVLFCTTLVLNIVALNIVNKYRKKYV